MLLNLIIKNYRSIKTEETFTLIAESSRSKEHSVFLKNLGSGKDEVRLLNTALIYGKNASGKSNILRCLYEVVMLVKSSSHSVGEDIIFYDPFLLSVETRTAPICICLEFVGKDNVKYKYDLEFNKTEFLREELVYYPKGKEKLLFTRLSPKGESIHSLRLGQDINVKKFDVFHNQTILSKFGKEVPHELISQVYLFITSIDVVNASSYRRVSNLRNEVSEFLKKNPELKSKMDELIVTSDLGINSLKIEDVEDDAFVLPTGLPTEFKNLIIDKFKYSVSGLHDVYENSEITKTIQTIPLDEESHGTKRIYYLGGKILKSLERGSVLFIDELETGLHTYLCKLLISLYQDKRINSKNAQLVFTTHDTNLLDRTMFRRDQIWFTEKDCEGKTEFFSLQDFNDVREDTPFEKWYLAGKFGGIPNVKSTESLFKKNGKN